MTTLVISARLRRGPRALAATLARVLRSCPALALVFVLALGPAPAQATPEAATAPALGGVLLASAQDEPGGFRLGEAEDDAPPPPVTAPERYRPSAPELAPISAPPRAGKDPLPGYLSLGLGAACALVGSIFAVRTVASLDDFPSLRRGQLVNAAFETQLEEAQTGMLVNGLLTSLFLSASVSSLVAGTLYLAGD